MKKKAVADFLVYILIILLAIVFFMLVFGNLSRMWGTFTCGPKQNNFKEITLASIIDKAMVGKVNEPTFFEIDDCVDYLNAFSRGEVCMKFKGEDKEVCEETNVNFKDFPEMLRPGKYQLWIVGEDHTIKYCGVVESYDKPIDCKKPEGQTGCCQGMRGCFSGATKESCEYGGQGKWYGADYECDEDIGQCVKSTGGGCCKVEYESCQVNNCKLSISGCSEGTLFVFNYDGCSGKNIQWVPVFGGDVTLRVSPAGQYYVKVLCKDDSRSPCILIEVV